MKDFSLPSTCRFLRYSPWGVLILLVAAQITAAEEWITLLGAEATSLSAWQEPQQGWRLVGDATLPPAPGKRLNGLEGSGVAINSGHEPVDLISREEFTDVELRLEFMLARGSNSGVKLNGLYEIQFLDTAGAEPTTGNMCGGVYPRSLGPPTFTYLDKGTPPRVNSAKPAGEWQKLELAFRSPRFDSAGRKTSPGRFDWVQLNGVLIHEHVEVACPTGAAWDDSPEVPAGPVLLQGNHGPVAFRKVAVRVIENAAE
jgi:hypothetical protein